MNKTVSTVYNNNNVAEMTINFDLTNSLSDSSCNIEEEVCLQDLYDSPEFLEEQRIMLLEFETAQVRISDKGKSPQRSRQEDRRRSRRSSVGVKITCPVCLENLSSSKCYYEKMVTQCGHMFCQDCIEDICKITKHKMKTNCEKHKQVKPLCPVCREEIGELRKVYF